FVFKKIKSKYFIADNRVIIKVKFALKTPFVKFAGIFEIEYSINANGVISVEYEYKNLKFKLIPKMGICLEMPKTFNNIRYFGYDMESLSDFHEHSVIKINSLTVSQMKCNYIKPQESGMRFNTFWAEITDESGIGFKFESAASFTFNASHYNALQCAKAAHKDDLTEYNTTVVNIDGFEMGAGSNSCGPIPGEAHRKMLVRKYRGNFKVIPVGD
ncbi:MAG: beta-galactosidase small subunit, partial [Clostridiales bacterium]|nr:beta-galactosidase small subunit [Clostridiales bacterium]